MSIFQSILELHHLSSKCAFSCLFKKGGVTVNRLKQIEDVSIYEHESVPSDHLPVYIHLKMKGQSSSEVPNVASWLEDNRFKGEPDRRAGKINGAEILSVIKSLTDSGHQRPDGFSVQTYKDCSCPLTEILKIQFNHWMKCQQLPKDLCASDDRKHFNVDYLIFTMILAKRLNVLLETSSEEKVQVNNNEWCFVTFAVKPHEIKWSFLANSLSDLLENVIEKSKTLSQEIIIPLEGLVDEDSTNTKSILKVILPKGSKPSDDLRKLQDGCPLTRSILSLVLKYLEIQIRKKNYTTHVSHSRQVVVIQQNYQRSCEDLGSLCKKFKEKSGIELNIVEINN